MRPKIKKMVFLFSLGKNGVNLKNFCLGKTCFPCKTIFFLRKNTYFGTKPSFC